MRREHIVQLLELLRAQRVKDGDDWVNCACPFAPWTHSKGTDSRPSFGVSVGKQSHYFCFSCHRSGPLPALVTSICMLRGQDNEEARKFVSDHEDFSLDPFENLEKSKEPLALLNPELVRKFCPAHPGLEIVKERGISTEMIDELDLRWDPKEGRLVFPVYNAKGQLVGFRGRSKERNVKLKTMEYSYLQPKKQSLKSHGIWYGMHRKVEKHQKIILVEGEMDMLSVVQALAKRGGVWAAMGSSISPEQIKTIQALKNPVLLFFDDDEAGEDAKRKLTAKLAQVKSGIYHVTNYCGRTDPDEIVRAGLLSAALRSIEQAG